ncbi:MAG TPA: outer membrane beta-barrel protein, partial [Polyangiaceae bacterium]|nr:outer membrane beta-barrel protein [Polyangiaceae bacterium]
PPPTDATPVPPPAPAPTPPLEPPPAPPVDAQPVEPPGADPEPDLPPAEAYAEAGDAWYDTIEFSAFVDAYASFNFNFPKPQFGKNTLRAHDQNNGFSLSWVGVNASYPADPVGATLSLRFGPTARQLGTSCLEDDPSKPNCDSGFGLENVKQGFASWKPGGADSAITLDFGKFDTPFGVEVAESHLNLNYTRSLLYWLAQPSFHTGLRGNFVVADAFDFRVLAVNGWNNSVDNNVGKSFGVQGTLHVRNTDGADMLTASLGYMIGPEHDDTTLIECGPGLAFSPTAPTGCASAGSSEEIETSGRVDRASSNTDGLRHLIDLVVVADPIERLRLVLNADYGIDRVRNIHDPTKFDRASYWGVLLGGRVAVVDEFGIALRGEYIADPDGYLSGYLAHNEEIELLSGTLTLEVLPADFLTVRLDNRIDWSNKQIFNKEIRDLIGTQFTTTLGVVAHTD